MRIAIQAADLDNQRIDGTRVYLLNLLKHFGELSFQDDFFIYHKNNFNPQLTPPNFSNYKIKRIWSPMLWTQTRFALEIWKDKIDVLWMPMHNIPLLKNKKTKTTVTIHDLAFKQFPETFPKKDLRRLNLLTDLAVRKSDKIIAVSNSTKKDILKFYPEISEKKIKVIYHGFDAKVFKSNYLRATNQEHNSVNKSINKILKNYNLQSTRYLLYVGAIQPRKNLKVLISAFEIFKNETGSKIKLVLAGEQAWGWKETIKAIETSLFQEDIILTGKLNFDELAILYQNTSLFVLPSLYEGFGIPILEAMASNVPIISANNSSLPEVGGEAVEYFNEASSTELAEKIEKILSNEELREMMIERGKKQLQKFSWEKCASETLEYLKN